MKGPNSLQSERGCTLFLLSKKQNMESKFKSSKELDEFTQWAVKNGCEISPKVKFMQNTEIKTQSGEYGSALIGLEPIEKREQLLSCPESIMISPRLAKSQFKDYYCHEDLAQAFTKLSLIWEYLKGENSSWAPYIKVLPKPGELDLPIFYNQEELGWIMGTNLKTDIEVRTKQWREEYDQLKELLSSSEQQDIDGVSVGQFSLDLYLWACGIFSSRSFPARMMYPGVEETLSILVPLIDGVNHKFEAPIHWDFMHGTRFMISPAREIPDINREIFNNYGPKSNEEFLFGYGFAIEDNTQDTASLKLPVAAVPSELIQQTLNAGYDLREDLVFFLTKHDPLPKALQMLFRLFVTHNSNQLEDPTTPRATIQSLETLKTGIRGKLANVESVKLPEPANGEPLKLTYARIYRTGQQELYQLALSAADRVITDTLTESSLIAYNIDTLAQDGQNQPFLETAVAAFVGEEEASLTDSLISSGVEDLLLLIYLCLTTTAISTTISPESVQSYQSMYSDVISPLNELNPETFPLDKLQPYHLAAASARLEANGVTYADALGRERYGILLQDKTT